MEKEISVQTALEKVLKGSLFVDVREKDELQQVSFDVINIINIPLSEFDKRFVELPKDRDLIMVCRGGGRSLIATNFLLSHGFTTVVNMRGGIMQWMANNFPTK